MTADEQTPALPRRQVLCGIMAVGLLGTTALTACSEDSAKTSTPASGTNNGGANNGGTPSGGANNGGANNPPTIGALAKVSDVPVGGGTIVQGADGKPIVLVQPSAGEIKAYDASCTHQGTTVGTPENGVMTCPNHGSKFKAADGSVVNGPAGSPLRSVAVTVNGDSIEFA
jgi:cytochrome b6-f complex iron-sulfur subunit